MIQYIDKSTLVARVKKLKMDIGNIFNEYDEGFWEGRATAFDDIICALDTIEVKEMNLEKELVEEIYSHIDSIINTADRMTTGNFMHNRAAIKFSAHTIAKVLELIGLKVQKEE